MDKEIKKLTKVMKSEGRKSKIFEFLSNAMVHIKAVSLLGVAIIPLLTGISSIAGWIVYACGLIAMIGDYMAEVIDGYGSNIAEDISLYFYGEKVGAENKLREKVNELNKNTSKVDSEAVKKAQKELGIETSFVIHKNITNKDVVEQEKEQ